MELPHPAFPSYNMLCKTSITLYKDQLIYHAIAYPITQIESRKNRSVTSQSISRLMMTNPKTRVQFVSIFIKYHRRPLYPNSRAPPPAPFSSQLKEPTTQAHSSNKNSLLFGQTSKKVTRHILKFQIETPSDPFLVRIKWIDTPLKQSEVAIFLEPFPSDPSIQKLTLPANPTVFKQRPPPLLYFKYLPL